MLEGNRLALRFDQHPVALGIIVVTGIDTHMFDPVERGYPVIRLEKPGFCPAEEIGGPVKFKN